MEKYSLAAHGRQPVCLLALRRIGCQVFEALASRCAIRFAAAHPGMRLRIPMESPAAVSRLVRARAVDLGVAEASVAPVFHEPWLSTDWAVARLRKRRHGRAEVRCQEPHQGTPRHAVQTMHSVSFIDTLLKRLSPRPSSQCRRNRIQRRLLVLADQRAADAQEAPILGGLGRGLGN